MNVFLKTQQTYYGVFRNSTVIPLPGWSGALALPELAPVSDLGIVGGLHDVRDVTLRVHLKTKYMHSFKLNYSGQDCTFITQPRQNQNTTVNENRS